MGRPRGRWRTEGGSLNSNIKRAGFIPPPQIWGQETLPLHGDRRDTPVHSACLEEERTQTPLLGKFQSSCGRGWKKVMSFYKLFREIRKEKREKETPPSIFYQRGMYSPAWRNGFQVIIPKWSRQWWKKFTLLIPQKFTTLLSWSSFLFYDKNLLFFFLLTPKHLKLNLSLWGHQFHPTQIRRPLGPGWVTEKRDGLGTHALS